MPGDSLYQDLQYKNGSIYSVLDGPPAKPPKPSLGTKTTKGHDVLERKLRIWRITTAVVSLLTILLIIFCVVIVLTKYNIQGTENTGLQKLKLDVCVKDETPCRYCASNWIYFSRSCYFFSTDSMNWTDSRDTCRHMESHLVAINTQEEETFVEQRGNGAFWIGLSKDNDSSWIWEDGTKLMGQGFWQPNEPNDLNGNEKCVDLLPAIFGNSSGWNDNNCKFFKHRICERPARIFA